MLRRFAPTALLAAALLAAALAALAGCGACEGRVTNGGPSHGRCTVFSVGL